MTAAFAQSFLGRTQEAGETVERWVGLARARTDELPYAATWLLGNFYTALAVAGRLTEAIAAGEESYRESVELHADLIRGPHVHFLGWIALVQGRTRTAIRWNQEAAGLLRETDFLRHLSATLADLAHCEALLGNVPAAEEALAEARVARVPSFRMDEGFIGRAETWTAVARGELSAGIELALGTAGRVGSMGQRFPEALSLHDAVRLGEPERVRGRLNELADLCDGDLIPAFARHADALVARDAAGLSEISESFEKMGAPLYASEAAAQATRMHRDAGRTGSAFASAARARALAERCEGARTPALAEIDGSLPLTRREREVATLAAGGLSNREIAERLVVSVRTVDNHLHSAYTKLGVGGRDELSVILDPLHDPLSSHNGGSHSRPAI